MERKKKCRQYVLDYLKFGFIPSPSNRQLPMCLICEQTFSNEAMKPSRLRDHLNKKHGDKVHKDLSYFRDLKVKFQNRCTVDKLVRNNSSQMDKGLLVSYKISSLIAKCGKPYTVGETLILPAVKEVIETMLGPGVSDVTRFIPLSNNSVSRRIDEMASDIESKLCTELQTSEFALQLDESTLCDNEALLLAYVRFVDKNGLAKEELLFAETLENDSKGLSIFQVVERFFAKKSIPLTNIIACATDGAPSMVGRYQGFIAHLKNVIPNVFAIHCVIHRQHLVAKHLSNRLHDSLRIIITAVNKIKARSLNDRLFRQLCHDNDEEFERLLLHTEVRWLSKGNCLRRFYELYDTVLEFFESADQALCRELEARRKDAAYLSDIFDKLNEVNLKLQGEKMNLIKAKGIITAFMAKLTLFRNNIGRYELYQFPSLQTIMEADDTLSDNDLETYCAHLDSLMEDMQKRFTDLSELRVPDWVINPFIVHTHDIPQNLQEELTELQNDCEAKIRFNQHGYEVFWVKEKESYPLLWQEVKLLILAFPTSYLVEKGFSTVVQLQTKQRNRLHISERGDLRLRLSNIEPDINKLVMSHQAQGSH